MNVQSFLIAHGEKLLVGLVALICAVVLYATLTDSETEAKATIADINEIVGKLNTAYQNPGRPNLAETRDFEAEIKARFRLQVDGEPVMAHLAGHPPVFKQSVGGIRHIYAYEIAVPGLEVNDRIGTFEIVVTLPGATRPNRPDDYIRDAADGAVWSRPVPSRGTVVNAVRPLGALVEYRIFQDGMGIDQGWQPIAAEGLVGGVVPLQSGSATVVVGGIEPWQTYDLRARTVIAATGTVVPDEAHYQIGREVIPLARPLPLAPPPVTWVAAKEQIQLPFENGELAKFLAEPYTGPVPARARAAAPRPRTGFDPGGMGGAQPRNQGAEAELARLQFRNFIGAPTRPLVSLDSRSPIYLGLKRASGGLQGIEPTATLIVKRLVIGQDGVERGWTPAVEYKLEAGEKVGKEVEELRTEWQSRRMPYDLSTPFVVESIEKDIERILYYELRLRSVPPDFDKELVLEPKTTRTDAVVLRNTKDESTLRLLEFERVREPLANRYVFPAVPPGGLDEEALFKEAPRDWQRPELEPRRPIQHDDKRLLEELVGERGAQLAAVPYFEFPDGRVYYYYPPENEVYLEVIPGSEWDRKGAPRAVGGEQPGGEQPMPGDGELPPDMPPEDFGPPPEDFEDMDLAPPPGRRRR